MMQQKQKSSRLSRYSKDSVVQRQGFYLCTADNLTWPCQCQQEQLCQSLQGDGHYSLNLFPLLTFMLSVFHCHLEEQSLFNYLNYQWSQKKSSLAVIKFSKNMRSHVCSHQKMGGNRQGSSCPPLLCLCAAPPAVLHQSLQPSAQEGMELLEWVRGGRKDDQRAGEPFLWRLKQLGLFSIWDTSLWPSSTWRELRSRRETNFLHCLIAIG